MIRESDNHPGVYPTHIRPDQDTEQPFNDNLTISAAPQVGKAELKFSYVPLNRSKLTIQDAGGRAGDFMFFENKPQELDGYATGSVKFNNVNHTECIGTLTLCDANNKKYYFKFGPKSLGEVPAQQF